MSPNAVPPKLASTAFPVASRRSDPLFKYARSAPDIGPNSSRLSSTRRWSSSNRALARQGVEIEASAAACAQGGTVLSPHGYANMSPSGPGSVLKPSGTNTGVPPNVVQPFQFSLRKPMRVTGVLSGTTSTSRASKKSGPISPSSW